MTDSVHPAWPEDVLARVATVRDKMREGGHAATEYRARIPRTLPPAETAVFMRWVEGEEQPA